MLNAGLPAVSRFCRPWDFFCPAGARIALLLLIWLSTAATWADQQGGERKVAPAPQLRVPADFKITLFADDNLAHDIYSMTVNSAGDVVVSGAGYVRTLHDRDRDGVADSFTVFADGPRSGAQGMFFDGNDLICSGDGGVIRYRDADGDGRADGPPHVMLKIPAGGEHHVHAIRRGPDGWWYVIAGNSSGIGTRFVQLPGSPIRQPQNGALLRLTRDFSKSEVVTDGFRNPYDFDFHEQGDVFVYDSDGERDVTLPWYRPTRVFQALPATNAGWFSRSWKRPDHFPDMPPVVGAFGRGSPTGVVCYRHRQFPRRYQQAVFVADWTFGRVLALPLKPAGSVWFSKPELFISGVGQFGFAPSDLCVAPDGSLLVSVGGRGTRGGVYRVARCMAREDEHDAQINPPEPGDHESTLTACLDAVEPLSSWSRRRWAPLARKLGGAALLAAARDSQRTPRQRVRAIEILVDLFSGLSSEAARALATDSSEEVRARTAWAVGRRKPKQPPWAELLDGDQPARVLRFALEALLTETQPPTAQAVEVARLLAHRDLYVRQTAGRVVGRHNLKLPAHVRNSQASVWFNLGRTLRLGKFDETALRTAVTRFVFEENSQKQLEALRLMQLALGDVGPGGGPAAVFDGYHSPVNLGPHRDTADELIRSVAVGFPTGNERLDWELARVLAIVATADSPLVSRLLDKVTAETHPSSDLHYLIALARIPGSRDESQQTRIAAALLDIERKVAQRKLQVDNNWEPRLRELYAELVRHDPKLPAALINHPDFGRPGHLFLLHRVDADLRRRAVDQVIRRINKDAAYPWSAAALQLLGGTRRAGDVALIRSQFDNPALRDIVLSILASRPESADRPRYVAGLDSAQFNVLKSCVTALGKLPAATDVDEQVQLVRLLGRLGGDRKEYALREDVVKLLRRNLAEQHGFQFGERGHGPQTEAIGRWAAALRRRYPNDAAVRALRPAAAGELSKRLADVTWDDGDAKRGKTVFESLACARCHGGRRAVGPPLRGVAKRFSRDDLFAAIAMPSRNVPLRYRPTTIETTKGRLVSGLVVYQSADGVTLSDGVQTIRVEANEIESQTRSNTSLMPRGLLDRLSSMQLADLYAYLTTLR